MKEIEIAQYEEVRLIVGSTTKIVIDKLYGPTWADDLVIVWEGDDWNVRKKIALLRRKTKMKTLSQKIHYHQGDDRDILLVGDVREFIKQILTDLVHYERTCGVCATQWGSLHCQHDGVQGRCPKCNTRARKTGLGNCDCEFTVKVKEIQEKIYTLVGERLTVTKTAIGRQMRNELQ